MLIRTISLHDDKIQQYCYCDNRGFKCACMPARLSYDHAKNTKKIPSCSYNHIISQLPQKVQASGSQVATIIILITQNDGFNLIKRRCLIFVCNIIIILCSLIERDRRCPDIRERCTRGCPLSRDESGCLVCRCEEPGKKSTLPCAIITLYIVAIWFVSIIKQ